MHASKLTNERMQRWSCESDKIDRQEAIAGLGEHSPESQRFEDRLNLNVKRGDTPDSQVKIERKQAPKERLLQPMAKEFSMPIMIQKRV